MSILNKPEVPTETQQQSDSANCPYQGLTEIKKLSPKLWVHDNHLSRRERAQHLQQQLNRLDELIQHVIADARAEALLVDLEEYCEADLAEFYRQIAEVEKAAELYAIARAKLQSRVPE